MSAKVGGVMLAVFVIFGVVGPWLAPFDPAQIDLAHRFLPASTTHWLGTDSNGIDTCSQLLWGAREALIISVSVVAISATIGLAIGTLAGWYRGVVDELAMRAVDILMAFPGILMNIAIVATVVPGLKLFAWITE